MVLGEKEGGGRGDCVGHSTLSQGSLQVTESNGLCDFSWCGDQIPDRNHLGGCGKVHYGLLF